MERYYLLRHPVTGKTIGDILEHPSGRATLFIGEDAKTIDAASLPEPFAFTLFAAAWDKIAPYFERAAAIFPSLQTAPIRRFVNGYAVLTVIVRLEGRKHQSPRKSGRHNAAIGRKSDYTAIAMRMPIIGISKLQVDSVIRNRSA